MPTSAECIRILIADADRIHAEHLRQLLEAEQDFLVLGETGTSADTLRHVQHLRPNVLLLDQSIPGAQGREMLRELAAIEPKLRTILVTDGGEPADLVGVLQLGARGAISRYSDGAILVRSVRKVMAGEYWVSRATVAELVHAVKSLLAYARDARSRKPKVTPRQQEIIASVVAGNSNREIAEQFSLSEDTVKRHLTNIFGRVGVSNRLELAFFASQHDLNDAT
jgi:two-component system nitrate/nitrite response regulator NarL